MESCVASLWRHCTWSHSRPITSTCTCALCVLTLRRCFPTFAGVFVLLAVVWRTRATGRLSEVLGFVVYYCWPCPLSSWFLRNFWFPELVEVAASLFLAPFPFLVGNDVCSATCYLLLASVYAHCGGDWMGFRGNSHVGPVFRWPVVLESISLTF